MAESEVLDDFATPGEKKDPIVRMWMEPGENIDVFTDIHPLLVQPINNLMLYAEEMERFTTPKGGLNPADTLRRCMVRYMRLCASKDRKSRGEVSGIFTAEKERTRVNTHIDGGNNGGETLR